MDGAVVSDIASGNSSPTYYDFDSFEEINVTKGGSDASQQGAGVQVNFITKSGGNTLRGSARYYDTNQRFEGNNITAAQRDHAAQRTRRRRVPPVDHDAAAGWSDRLLPRRSPVDRFEPADDDGAVHAHLRELGSVPPERLAVRRAGHPVHRHRLLRSQQRQR